VHALCHSWAALSLHGYLFLPSFNVFLLFISSFHLLSTQQITEMVKADFCSRKSLLRWVKFCFVPQARGNVARLSPTSMHYFLTFLFLPFLSILAKVEAAKAKAEAEGSYATGGSNLFLCALGKRKCCPFIGTPSPFFL
jgi:hypothetical protein